MARCNCPGWCDVCSSGPCDCTCSTEDKRLRELKAEKKRTEQQIKAIESRRKEHDTL